MYGDRLMQPEMMLLSKSKKGHFLDFGNGINKRHFKKTRGTPTNLRGAQFGKHGPRGTKTFHKILRGTSTKKVKKH